MKPSLNFLRSLIVCGTLAICNYSPVQAQSDVLRRGQSGIMGGAGYCVTSGTETYSVLLGYSYFGFLDGGVIYSKANHGPVTQGIITPTLTFFPVKQEDAERVPTLGISLGFNHYTKTNTEWVSAPHPDSTIVGSVLIPLTKETTVDALQVGVTAERRIGYLGVLFLQPSIGGKISISSEPWEFTLRGGISIGTRIVNGPIIVLTPGFELQSGLRYFTILLRTIF
jgi:hypothetical protein